MITDILYNCGAIVTMTIQTLKVNALGSLSNAPEYIEDENDQRDHNNGQTNLEGNVQITENEKIH